MNDPLKEIQNSFFRLQIIKALICMAGVLYTFAYSEKIAFFVFMVSLGFQLFTITAAHHNLIAKIATDKTRFYLLTYVLDGMNLFFIVVGLVLIPIF